MAQKGSNKVPLVLHVDKRVKKKVEAKAKKEKRSGSSAGELLLIKGLETEANTAAA